MVSKREVKKLITYMCGDLAAATIFTRDFVEGTDEAAANALIGRIADLQVKTLRQCTFSFDKSQRDFENAHAYRKALAAYRKAAYKKIREDFYNEVNAIVKDLNALAPSKKA